MEHVIIRVCKYGFEHEKFSINELIEKKEINKGRERDFVLTLMEKTLGSASNPHSIGKLVDKVGESESDWKYTLVPSALFSYIDHIELKEAKKYAKEAKYLSLWAISISVISLVASVVIGWLQIK